ncbi:PI-PLC X domain-containing protein 1-like [Stegodyphus dumicola]|uniref:PI-PLC X domain-containing protein 1-like n=1 Tax=Stegodyphus dumicola TaxID=202533 RepID=UPI0015B0ABEA|nr:PI-PLC X domain-containing protein 1-like [Stegodyphus dumicola]XP_035228829.1 PI-PLC X domain-containing protein 1-like [Stegodyphus dumicola]XP_035228830.1 PI-PLC X domain-containing protein 1-like [Stegodyphus dumicola]
MLQLHKLTFPVITWTVVIHLTFTAARCWVTSQRIDADDKISRPRVLLSVSSLASHTPEGVITERLLELNWFDAPHGMNEDPTSWVGLFNHDPTEGSNDPLEVAPTKTHPDGYYKTRVPFPRIEFFDNITDECLGYWIGYINLNRLVAKSCIRARPRWMQEMRHIIGNRTLKELMLPGTHNAGSYEPYRPDRNTAKVRYQICHDEDIFNQLVYGNRFLDLRVIFQHVAGSKEKFWITHNILRTNNTVKDVLAQVKRFLDNTNEIVIMDFHLFYMGFIDSWVDDRHKELMSLIVRTLGHYMMPTSFEYSTTLNEIWKSNKRLLVGYASKQAIESTLLFPGAFHLWGNKETRPELEEFLERNMCHFRHRGLWSAMAELTPTTAGVLIDKYGGLRNLAQEVNSHVTKWFRERWWKCANIVSTDYFLGNNIIDVAIEANAKKIRF